MRKNQLLKMWYEKSGYLKALEGRMIAVSKKVGSMDTVTDRAPLPGTALKPTKKLRQK